VTAVESGIVRCLSVAIVLLTAILAAAQSERRFALVAGADRAGNPLLGLQADDFIVENDHVPCDVIDVRSAAYPLAIIVDTSNVARSDFQSLRQAVHHFVNGASRDIAVYTSGEPAVRVQGFTRDQGSTERAIDHLFAGPDGASHTLAAIFRVATDLRALNAPVTAMVVVSAGGVETNAPGIQDVLRAMLASHTILHVIDRRPAPLVHSTPLTERLRGSSVPPDSSRRGRVLEALAGRTHGEYISGLDATVYAIGLDAIRRQLEAEVIVEYAAAADAPRELRLGIKAGRLGRAIGLDRAP
jgi:hypothetical protein